MKTKKQKIVVVSGGFDPLHLGHIKMLKSAKSLGTKLIVILNNDNWLRRKKGFVFMKQNERKIILESIKYVDQVVLTSHSKKTIDMSVCRELAKIKPHIFCQGGDRNKKNIPPCEVELQNKLKFIIKENIGGKKVQSSSQLVKKASQ